MRWIKFDWQIIPFGLSALIGAMIAYNTTFAWLRFTLIMVGVMVYLLFANLIDSSNTRSPLRNCLAALPTIIAVWFILTNDWSRAAGKLSVLDPVLSRLSLLRLLPGFPQINPNVIGGVIGMLLPLQVAAVKGHRRTIKVMLIGVSLLGLLLSETRSAWSALMIVTAMGLAWKVLNRRAASQRQARSIWFTLLVTGAAIGLALMVATPIGLTLLDASGDRPNIWRNSLDLASDYPVTGFGLGDFEMTYSTYALLVHVGHTAHAHNLWLDIWLEQGLLGLVAWAGLMLNAIWPKPASPWRMAALAALGVMLLHTLADDPFYGYGGAAIPMMFIPLGLLARPHETAPRPRLQPASIAWVLVGGAAIIAGISPGGRARIESDLGALSQTRHELAIYRWPDMPMQDILRRSGGVDLSEALAHYHAALVLDPSDPSANRRLGQIELSQGNYVDACAHLQTAYRAAPQQRATRQLLGECAALNGDRDQAMQLWQSIDVSESQLDIRQWWYSDYLADHDRAAKLRQAINALNDQQTLLGANHTY